ncbi:MAG: DUF3127 domain-containing protein [Leptolyngbyaceae cyanobacterium RM2_2_4]|nr:DUF3127 domain-containing protein [Leptolyngbyaceae cyanobacterium RM2_2_4]
MDSIIISGTITEILPEEKVSEKFTKQDIIVELETQYPTTVAISFVNQKIALLRECNIGDFVDVAVNIESREWGGRWYTNVRGWRVRRVSSDHVSPTEIPSARKKEPREPEPKRTNRRYDDLDDADVPF